MQLCLFDAPDEHGTPSRSIRHARAHRPDLARATCPTCGRASCTAIASHGPYDPREGHRFNRHKLLDRPLRQGDDGRRQLERRAVTATRSATRTRTCRSTTRDSAAVHAEVRGRSTTAFTWGDDRPPRVPWNRTVIYECHVRGMTMLHPGVPEELRGTYLGMATDPIIEHLLVAGRHGGRAAAGAPLRRRPRACVEQGLTNYWGYNSLAFFAPDAALRDGRRSAQQVAEFKSMVKALHAAGHRGDPRRGLQPHRRGQPPRARRCRCAGSTTRPTTGSYAGRPALLHRLHRHAATASTCAHPRTVQLIMDSLRYWVEEMHVDGFRFDLAPVLARELYEVNRLGDLLRHHAAGPGAVAR